MKKTLFLLLALALAGGGFWYFRSGQTKAEIKILETARVVRGSVRQVMDATGIVKPQVGAIVKIGSRATGVISRMLVKVGDKVKKGQPVAEIDDRELQAERREVQAKLRAMEARTAYADKNLPRRRLLVQKDLEAVDTLDQATQAAEVARHEAAIERAKLNSIDVRLSYFKIYSPIDGVVSEVTAQSGETVVAGLQVANLITVIDPARLEMWIYVDETDVGQVKLGLPVEYRVDAYPDQTFQGTVAEIYPQPEIRDNIVYYKTLVRVGPQYADRLKPEMTTQCRVIITSLDDVLILPNRALKWVDGRQVVFAVGPDGKPEIVRPRLGVAGPDVTQVLEGLSEGQEVAVQVVLPGKAQGAAQPPAGAGSGAGSASGQGKKKG